MKILHLNASDIGSTGKIVQDICREASRRNWESISIFPKRNRMPSKTVKEYAVSMKYEQAIYRRIYYFYGLHYGFAPISTHRILNIIKSEKPDVVHLHSVNCAFLNIYKLLDYLQKSGIATVITHHAEFFYTGNCPHAFSCEKWKSGCGNCPCLFYATDSKLLDRTHTAWLKMREAFKRFQRGKICSVSVSPWVFNRASESPILEHVTQKLILNGVNTNIFKIRNFQSSQKLKENLNVTESTKIFFNVTSNFSPFDFNSKGGGYLCELANRFLGDDVLFLVAGKFDTSLKISKLPSNLVLLGQIIDQDLLAEYYCVSDLTLSLSKRETYGMTVAESLCCGTPVVGFLAGGPESIALTEFSEFFSFSSVDQLEKKIRSKWINFKDRNGPSMISEKAMLKYSDRNMANEYCNLYNEMLM